MSNQLSVEASKPAEQLSLNIERAVDGLSLVDVYFFITALLRRFIA
jgi:hypothetical protein